jgi:hypothetical protein
MRPEFFNPDSKWKFDVGNICLASARWVLLLLFFFTMGSSSLYLLQRWIEAVNEHDIGMIFAVGLLCLVMAYNLWVICIFMLAAIFHIFCKANPGSFGNFILAMNHYLVDRMSYYVFGVDKASDGGMVVDVTGRKSRDDELLDRMDRLEKKLERALAQNEAMAADDGD